MSGSVKDPVRYGHVAASIREAMKRKEWNPPDFNKAMGFSASHSGIYLWRSAKAAPGPSIRAEVAKVLGLKIEDVTPKGPLNAKHMTLPLERAAPLFNIIMEHIRSHERKDEHIEG